MSQRYTATPEAYHRVFEQSREGAAVLEDLVARFSNGSRGEGIDRILNMAEQQGSRKVLDFILSQINRANGVNDNAAEAEIAADE